MLLHVLLLLPVMVHAGTDMNSLMQDAARGNANAQYDLAVLFERGEGGSLLEAQHWYEEAAKNGHAGAKIWIATRATHEIQQIENDMVFIWGDLMMGKFNVTQGQWQAVMGSNPAHFIACGRDCPMESVSWNDVQTFIQKLNQQTDGHYRLPTQAEWERACGMQTHYCGGDNLDVVAWYEGNSNRQAHAVGQKRANDHGLYDMSGNVWQWTSDCYKGDCNRRMARGGSWNHPKLFLRSTYSTQTPVGTRNYGLGFRLATDAQYLKHVTSPQTPIPNEKLRQIENDMVSIRGDFKIGKYDVTQGQWQDVMGSNPSHFVACGENCPVENVSWNVVQTFIQKLNQQTGKRYRLPTRAEWELACGMQTDYCGGNNLDDVAWYSANSGMNTHPAGQKKANANGLYDMSGNVRQWTSDCYNGMCDGRWTRGGAWNEAESSQLAKNIYMFKTSYRSSAIGFRLVQDL